MAKTTAAIRYKGSKFWLIFWLIILFPVAIVLLFRNIRIISHNTMRYYEYSGIPFWLYFWMILFFPIGILLLVLNGAFVKKTGR